jgi:uncharacterized OB-fold protein
MSEPDYVTIDKYFQFLNQEKLMGSKCTVCGHVDLPARRLCSKCFKESAWVELSGKGTLETFTSVFVGAKVMVDKGYDRKKPYVFAIAKMAEGPSVSGQLINVDGLKYNDIKIGLSLKVVFLQSTIGTDAAGKPIIRTDIGFEPL